MKKIGIVTQGACAAILCTGFVLGCKTDDSLPDDPAPSGKVISADTLSDHLRFVSAVKIEGTIPKSSSASSLQVSFEDTLFLDYQGLMPIRFLHENPSENIAGVYLQIYSGGTSSSYYYDVPKIPNTVNDTVSTIMVGIDITGIVDPNGVPPAGPVDMEVIITPHGPDGQPIATAERPVKLSFPNPVDGSCSIVNPPGEFWQWILTNDGFSGPYEPGTVFDSLGQDIKGCCVDGISGYGATCLNEDPKNLRTLRFPTTYQINFEMITFRDNGTFTRETIENTNNPVPEESNFCGTGPGVVRDKIKHVHYEGNWKITQRTPNWMGGDASAVSMATTSSTDFGFGNPGGIIHQLQCELNGSLVLIQPDLERGGRDIYKFYMRVTNDRPIHYYPFG